LEEAESGLIQHTERILAQGHAGPNRREQERRGRREGGGKGGSVRLSRMRKVKFSSRKKKWFLFGGWGRNGRKKKKVPESLTAFFVEKQGSPLGLYQVGFTSWMV
jgi:hypothetical protein